MSDAAVARVAEVLEAAKCEAWKSYDWKEWHDADYDMVFDLADLRVFIGNCYAAWDGDLINKLDVDVVVNMMGPLDICDSWNKLYGPRQHWEQDKVSCAAAECLGPRVVAHVERYMDGPAAFYQRLGCSYIEEASADVSWNDMKGHFASVNQQLAVIVRERQDQKQSQNMSDGEECAMGVSDKADAKKSGKVCIFFHCYGGRNRSGAALSAFRKFWDKDVSMKDVVCELARRRPITLTQGRGPHNNFLKNLLEYEAALDADAERRA